MMKTTLFNLVFCLFLLEVHGQRLTAESCSSKQVVKDFDALKVRLNWNCRWTRLEWTLLSIHVWRHMYVGQFTGRTTSEAENDLHLKWRTQRFFNDFCFTKYAGKWFEVYRYEQPFTTGCECVTATYTLGKEKVGVKNCCFRNNSPGCLQGSAQVSYPDQQPLEARLNVSFFGSEYVQSLTMSHEIH